MCSTQPRHSMVLRSSRRDIFSRLSSRLQLQVLNYLNLEDLLVCCRVCRIWNKIVTSSKPTWLTLCRMYGLVYVGKANEAPDMCKKFFLSMARRLMMIRSGACCFIKTLPQCPCHARSNILAFHYHNFKIAVATDDNFIRIYTIYPINILSIVLHEDFNDIIQLRLDGTYVFAATERGVVKIWDSREGHLVSYIKLLTITFSFDLLKNTLIVACGVKGGVRVADLGSNRFAIVQTTKGLPVLKVGLTRTWSGYRKSKAFLLFCLNRCMVYVHEIMVPTISDNKTGFVNTLHKISLSPQSELNVHPHMFICRPSFCYDGTKYLYFPKSCPYTRTNIICKFNVQTGEIEDTVKTRHAVDQLLGVGKMNLAFTTRDEYSMDVWLYALDNSTKEERVCYPLASGNLKDDHAYLRILEHQSSFIGETSWLDGFNGRNDLGINCVYQNDSGTLNMVCWTPR